MSPTRVPRSKPFIPSPVKKRNPKKSQTVVVSQTKAIRLAELRAKLAKLSPATKPETETVKAALTATEWADIDMLTEPTASMEVDVPKEDMIVVCEPTTRRTVPDKATITQYERWLSLLPQLQEAYLEHLPESVGLPLQPRQDFHHHCSSAQCAGPKTAKILCLFLDHFEERIVPYCGCRPLAVILVRHGLFPAAPHRPRIAFAITLLDFYQSLFERACNAINALASALNTFYERRGFYLRNQQGLPTLDPFRHSLTNAVQWYDCLQVRVKDQVDQALERCFELAQSHSPAKDIPEEALGPGTCPRILQDLCPACFGGTRFGRSFQQGADIHVSTDGNRHHRRLKSAGEGPAFYQPKQFLSKEFVDGVGKDIAAARKRKPKTTKPKVPDIAIDSCEKSHYAANDHKGTDHFDDQGLMSLVCRHDIPLFFANVDTPGEEQKYAVALIKHLFSLLPAEATVVVLYDIGCVLDRSLELYDILPGSITIRLRLVLTAMHSYRHQWSCQIVFGPRFLIGLGLTDGEGVERVWALLIGLIGMERRTGRQRRIWLLERLIRFVCSEHRNDLGDWLRRKLKGLESEAEAANSVLEKCGVGEQVLREQWELQKESQLSVSAHAPARLKQELEQILQLQTEIDGIHESIQKAKTVMRLSRHNSKSLQNLISGLVNTQTILKTQIDELYASLEIVDEYPELRHVNLDFLKTLLLARDLKMNIRKKAVGTFFEWERLDRAVGGQNIPLGTKLHQATRNSITKRKPALLQALNKYNEYCGTLRKTAPPNCPLPIPKPLPQKLSELRDIETSGLMEDVWITPSDDPQLPRWLEDIDVRRGIRALHKLDRCNEERQKLAAESDNICRWFGNKLASIEVALRLPQFASLSLLIQQRRYRLLGLQPRWINTMVSSVQFDRHISNATNLAKQVTGASQYVAPVWLPLWTADHIEQDEGEEGDDIQVDPGIMMADVFEEEQEVRDEEGSSETEHEEGEELTVTPNDAEPVHIVTKWELPTALQVLLNLLSVMESLIKSSPMQGSIDSPRRFDGSDILGLPRTFFDKCDLRRLQNPRERLNDVCMNASSSLVHLCLLTNPSTQTAASRCAVFSSYVMRYAEDNSHDEDLWRNTKTNLYWRAKVWVIPVHRRDSEHWVVCTIYIDEGRILFFDSFANQATLQTMVPALSRLVMTLVTNARNHGHSLSVSTNSWLVQPLVVWPTQTNHYDCGVWSLCVIITVLSGCHGFTNLVEDDMLNIRKRLLALIYALPAM